ncbi:MAG TPA: biopolymer transporter ExbD [Planctomycetota bacterium]|nr:biopolymer transporter ExbD [Planctomycetota bacterium]
MSKKGAGTSEYTNPNLIPMIDIMFLLLLFFMLGADMGQRELEEVVLPKANSMKEDKENKEKDKNRLTINVYHRYEVKCQAYAKGGVCRDDAHWRTGIKGKDYSEPEKLGGYLKKEADATRGLDPKNPQVSELKVMIRADASAPYGLAQRAMNTCAKAGIYKVEVGASRPMDQTKKHG